MCTYWVEVVAVVAQNCPTNLLLQREVWQREDFEEESIDSMLMEEVI
jgi:hypothetical protein